MSDSHSQVSIEVTQKKAPVRGLSRSHFLVLSLELDSFFSLGTLSQDDSKPSS
jgi:hypothetical protein